jgi:hypothetical protein
MSVHARILAAMLASGGCWIRTNEGKSRQVYSLLPLATRETLQKTVFVTPPSLP